MQATTIRFTNIPLDITEYKHTVSKRTIRL